MAKTEGICIGGPLDGARYESSVEGIRRILVPTVAEKQTVGEPTAFKDHQYDHHEFAGVGIWLYESLTATEAVLRLIDVYERYKHDEALLQKRL